MATDRRSYHELVYNSAIIVASVTVILYLFGYLYYAAFCNRLSIPYVFTDISISQCITAALLPFAKLIAAFMVAFIFHLTVFRNKSKEKWIRILLLLILIFLVNIMLTADQQIFMLISVVAFIILVPLFIKPKLVVGYIAVICFILFHTSNVAFPNVPSILMVAMKISVGMLIVSVVCQHITSKESDIVSYIDELKISNISKICALIVLILTTCFVSNILGIGDAERMIDGTSSDALWVNISLKDKDNTLFENKTLIFVMLRDDTYYVVEKDESHPNKPRVYIIPSDQIKMAVVYEKGRGWFSDPPS